MHISVGDLDPLFSRLCIYYYDAGVDPYFSLFGPVISAFPRIFCYNMGVS